MNAATSSYMVVDEPGSACCDQSSFRLETDLVSAHGNKIGGGITERARRFRLQDLRHGQDPEGPTNFGPSVRSRLSRSC